MRDSITVGPTPSKPELLFLWHPGGTDIFSGYGLAVTPTRVVGLVMMDRPNRADRVWLAKIRATCGSYKLAAMT